jgi:hypothetical protein
MRFPKISRASFDVLVKDTLPTLRGEEGQACMSSGGSTGIKLKEEFRWAMGIPGRTNSSVFQKGQRDGEQVRKIKA